MRSIDLLKFQTVLELPYVFYEVLPLRTRGSFNYAALSGKQGIYFIVQDFIPLYIGMSVDIRQRLIHHEFRRFPQRVSWIRLPAIHIHIAAMDTTDPNRIYALEQVLISRYQPLCNRDVKSPLRCDTYAALAASAPWLEERDAT